jgi:uncharacterized protein
MENIYIPQLQKQPDKTLVLQVDTHLPDLETLMPVKGELTLIHQGTYLEVRATAETIVTLTCHRCLKHYNYRVAVSPMELLWLETPPDPATLPLEQEVSMDDLVETLPPDGYFDPNGWLYEQICLALPQRQICDSACGGIEFEQEGSTQPVTEPVDDRWSVLAQLKQQMNRTGES